MLENNVPLNLEISLNNERLDLLDRIVVSEGNYFFAIGVKFCPKVCNINGKSEQTFDIGDMDQGEGICYDIFNEIFQKLKDKNLVKEYYLDELSCFIEASHPDFEFLDLITSVQTKDYYGIGFDLINCKIEVLILTKELLDNIKKWLNEVIIIIKEISENYTIMKNNENYKIENFLNIEMHSTNME